MNKIVLEIHDPLIDTQRKVEDAIESLAKATGMRFEIGEHKPEPTPYPALRELGDAVYHQVNKQLGRLFDSLSRNWLHVKPMIKAATDPVTLNGKTVINPATGHVLTEAEWAVIQKELQAAFSWMYGNTKEMMLLYAMAVGKVLQGMAPDQSTKVHLVDLDQERLIEDIQNRDTPMYHRIQQYADIHTGELIQDVTQRSRRAIMDTILTGYHDVAGTKELQSRLFDEFADLNRDWRRIAETETAINFNNGYLMAEAETRKDENEVIYLKGLSGAEACPWCRANINDRVVVLADDASGGESVTIDKETYGVVWPGKNNYGRSQKNWWVCIPAHPHCVLPDEEVLSFAPSAVMKGFYKGTVIEIRTESGRRISVTENHPILTAIGFVLAKFLDVGDYVISSVDGKRMASLIVPDHNQRPTAIKDLYTAALHSVSSSTGSMKRSSKDFHGDGVFLKGNIDVVYSDSFLVDDVEFVQPQPLSKHSFAFSHDGGGFTRSSNSLSVNSSLRFSSDSSVSVISEFEPFQLSESRHSKQTSARSIMWNDALFDKSTSEGRATHTEFSRELLLRFSMLIPSQNSIRERRESLVTVDRIVSFHKVLYEGDVYDLTDSAMEMYIDNGVMVKNCRCTFVRYHSWAAETIKKLRAAMA